MSLTEYSNDIPYSSTAYCYYLPRRIPFQPMNYKDALNVSINDKLTKAKLIDIANTLQDRCLLSELDKPELISPQSYIKDIVSRFDIHHHEMRELNKDVRYLASYIKNVFVNVKYKLDDIRHGEFIDGQSNT